MNVSPQPRSGLAIPFDHERLDRLMDEAGIAHFFHECQRTLVDPTWRPHLPTVIGLGLRWATLSDVKSRKGSAPRRTRRGLSGREGDQRGRDLHW